MILEYKGKKSTKEILSKFNTSDAEFKPAFATDLGRLYHGDNLEILAFLGKEFKGKVDLIYLDPPFATNNKFFVNDERTATISSSKKDTLAYSDNLINDEYLEFIRERLIILRELLSDKGSIYLHIDYKIGHYIKIIMDEVFGRKMFRNDITRIKCNPKNFKRKGYGNIKDMVLFYSKNEDFIWHEPKEKRSDGESDRLFSKIDESGRRYTTNPLHAPGETSVGESGQSWRGVLPPKGRHWRYSIEKLEELDKNGLIHWSSTNTPRKIIYADEMPLKKVQDIWEFKDTAKPIYPTEKNSEMLKRIILASSNEDSIILDPFCGSGSTAFVCEKLNRKWLTIDLSEQSIKVATSRFS